MNNNLFETELKKEFKYEWQNPNVISLNCSFEIAENNIEEIWRDKTQSKGCKRPIQDIENVQNKKFKMDEFELLDPATSASLRIRGCSLKNKIVSSTDISTTRNSNFLYLGHETVGTKK